MFMLSFHCKKKNNRTPLPPPQIEDTNPFKVTCFLCDMAAKLLTWS